ARASGPYIYASATAIYGSTLICGSCFPGDQSLSVSGWTSLAPFNTPPPVGAFATDATGAPIYGAVWRLSLNGGLLNGSGSYELIAKIPDSNRVSLGQIAYNPKADVFYVSNFNNGLIYIFNNPPLNSAPVTNIPDTYDHGLSGRPAVGLPAVADDQKLLFTQYDRRVW